MQNIFNNKKIIYALAGVLIVGFAFAIPVYKHKTTAQHIAAIFNNNKVYNEIPKLDLEDDAEIEGLPIEEAWTEIEKLKLYDDSEDSITISGTIQFYDNWNEKGIKDKQKFTFQQAGNYQILTIDSFDRVQLPNKMVMIDHIQKVIEIQNAKKQDSIVATLKTMDKKGLKNMLSKDGVRAKIEMEGDVKVLHIYPSNADAINTYSIYYNPTTYEIKKYAMSYNNFPYEEDNNDSELSEDSIAIAQQGINDNILNNDKSELDIASAMTEYVVEYTIEKQQKKCSFNFANNTLFSIDNKAIVKFKSSLKNYEKDEF